MNQDFEEMGGAPPGNPVPQGNPAHAAPINAVSPANQKLINNLDQVNPQGYLLDNIINSISNLVEGYDNSGISTTMASTIIKLKHGHDAKNSDHLDGATLVVTLMLAQRLLGSAIMVADNAMREYDRYVDESKRKEKLHEQMESKNDLLGKLIRFLEDDNGDYSQSIDVLYPGYRVNTVKKLREYLPEVLFLMGSYEFCLMEELPDNDPQNAVDGKFYLDTDGNFCVRDPRGNVHQGKLPDDPNQPNYIYINQAINLKIQFKDAAFKAAILRWAAGNDFTYNLYDDPRPAQAAQVQMVINDAQIQDDDEQAELIPADEDVELAPIEDNDVISEYESAWFVINEVAFRIALGSYLSNYDLLTPYDKHILYSTLRQATHGDEEVAREYRKLIIAKNGAERNTAATELTKVVDAALKKPITVTKVNFFARVVKAVGNFIFGNTAGISVVTGIAGLIAFAVPGAAIVMLGVYVAAIGVGLVFATTKVGYDLYKERKHDKIKSVIDKETGRHGQAVIINNLLDKARKLSSLRQAAAADHAHAGEVPGPQIGEAEGLDGENREAAENVEAGNLGANQVEYDDKLKSIKKLKGEYIASKVITIGYVSIIGALTGASFVNAISSLVVGISAEVGTGLLGLTGAAATALPIVGAGVATGFFIFKTVLSLYQDHKEIQKRITEVDDNLAAQTLNAKFVENNVHREINQLSREKLLEKYISDYLTSAEGISNTYNMADTQEQVKVKAKARANFFRKIEQLAGESKDEALSPSDYYNYLGHTITTGALLPEVYAARWQVIRNLRAYMPEQEVVAQPITVANVTHEYPTTFSAVANNVITPTETLLKKPWLFRYRPAGEGYEFLAMPASGLAGAVKPNSLATDKIYLEKVDDELIYTVINPTIKTLGKLAVKAETGRISFAQLEALGYNQAQLQGLRDNAQGVVDLAAIRSILPGVLKFATDPVNGHIHPKADHAGNWKRVRTNFTSTTNFIFGAMTPVIVGFAIALTFASGPAFPIVAGVMAGLLIGAFIASKILEYRHKQRMKSYDEMQAQIEMRDKAVEYDPRIRPALDPVAIVNPQDQPANANNPEPHPPQAGNQHAAEAIPQPANPLADQAVAHQDPVAIPQQLNHLQAQAVEVLLAAPSVATPSPVSPRRDEALRMSGHMSGIGIFAHSEDKKEHATQSPQKVDELNSQQANSEDEDEHAPLILKEAAQSNNNHANYK
jgi:hypothetical protein